NFDPHRGSVGIQVVAPADAASGRGASNVVASRSAYQFFGAESLQPQLARFVLSADDACPGESVFRVVPNFVPEGWSVKVAPEIVALEPGQEADVTVVVRPPRGAQPGASADIGIAVQQTEDTPSPLPTNDSDHPVDPRLLKHNEHIGWMEV